METTNVYSSADCLQAWADQVAHGQTPELIDRMGFDDPKLFVLLGLTLRIDKAKKLLAATELRIIDVALAVGYQTPSAFAASFRRFTGMTASEFRRRL